MNRGRRSSFPTKTKPKAKRLRERRRNRRFAFIGIGLGALFIFILLMAWVSRLPKLSIQNIAVSGATVTATTTLRDTVERQIAGAYGGLFSRKNIFLFSSGGIAQSLAAAFPAVLSATVTLQTGNTLDVQVTERTPWALWCHDETNALCYFMDANGLIFATAPAFSGPVYVRYYGGMATSSPLGGIFVTDTEFKNLQFSLRSLESLVSPITSVSRTDDGSYTLGLKTGTRIFAGDSANFTRLIDNLQTVFQNPKIKSALTSGSPALDYIDLRLDNKVFYKFK